MFFCADAASEPVLMQYRLYDSRRESFAGARKFDFRYWKPTASELIETRIKAAESPSMFIAVAVNS